jgi:biopolymer transport protein ExbB/TolQ
MSIILMNDAALRQYIAGQNPIQLLKQQSFWIRHKSFFLIIGAYVTASWFLSSLIYNNSVEWICFDLSVQFFIIFGAVITAKSLASIEVETAIACEVESRGADYLGDIKSGQRTMVDLDKLEETMLPNNPSNPQPAMVRMFQHICKEAKDRRFESSISITQPYRDEMFEAIFKLQNIQKISLWLGILGSFIGLLNAITNIDLGMDNVLASLPNILKQMFKGLAESFSASLIGLEVAVVLGLFLLMLRKRQESYVRQMESAAITMLSLARHAVNRDDFLTTFEQVSHTIKVVGERCNDVTQSVADQTKRIEDGIRTLSSSETHFKKFLDEIAKSQDDFITQMKSMYNKQAMIKLGDELRQSIIEAGQQMANTLNANASGISGAQKKFNETVTSLTASIEKYSQEATFRAEMIHTELKNSLLQTSTELKKYVEQTNSTLSKNNNASMAGRAEMEMLSKNIKSLASAVRELKQLTPCTKQGFFASLKNLIRG